jgi:hypothetical protein
MVHTAMAIGMAGMIVNGGIRDAAEIREMGFPLFARGVNPNGPSKEGPGEINFSISCGGKIVTRGTSSWRMMTAWSWFPKGCRKSAQGSAVRDSKRSRPDQGNQERSHQPSGGG